MTLPNFSRVFWACVVILAVWSVWAVHAILFYAPGHDEAITLLNMVNNASPSWDAIATTTEHRSQFSMPLADFSDIAPMLKQTDVHPPLFYYLSLGLSKIGLGGLIGLRLMGFFLSLSGMALLAMLVVRFSKPGSWSPAVMLALISLSTTAAYAGVNARSYGMVLFGVSVFAWSVYALSRKPVSSFVWPVIFILSSVGLIWTHYFGVLVVFPAFVVLLFVMWSRSKGDNVALSFMGISGILCMAFLMPWIEAHFGARPNQYAGFLGSMEAFSFARLIFEQVSFTFLVSGGMLIAAFGFILLAWMFLKSFLRGKDRLEIRVFASIFLMGSLFLIGLFWATDKTLASSDASRYGMFLFPFFACVALSRMEETWSRLTVSIVIALGLASFSLQQASPNISPWRYESNFASHEIHLNRGDTALVFDTAQRGIAGHLAWRTDQGWLGFVRKNEDIETFMDSLTPEISIIIFYASSSPKDNLKETQENFKAALSEAGFKNTDNGVWRR